ncbi:MAG: Ig-like domain-containing protein [Spirochaetes bacterium]|nr:Ig-like domain-containing protein [Spirochaetota bacterium]
MISKSIILILCISLFSFLACEGVIPLSVITDDTPPVIKSVYPANGTANAAKNTMVYVEFDDVMNPTSIFWQNVSCIYVTKAGETEKLQVNPKLEESGTTILLEKTNSFYEVGQTYTVTVEPGIRNAAYLAWESSENYTFSFTVVDRLEYYNPVITITGPKVTMPVHHANNLFDITGVILDPIGCYIARIQYQKQTQDDLSWEVINEGLTNFSLAINPEDTSWRLYPETNVVHFRVVGKDSQENEKVGTAKFEFVLDKWNKTVLVDSVSTSRSFDYVKDGSDEYIAAFYQAGPTGWFCLYKNGEVKFSDGNGAHCYPDITVHDSKVCIAAEHWSGDNKCVKHLMWDESSGYSSTSPYSNDTCRPQIAYGDFYSTICIFNGKYSRVIACISNEVFVTNTEINYTCATKLAYDKVNKIAHIAVVDQSRIIYLKFNANTKQFGVCYTLGSFGHYNPFVNDNKKGSDICIDDSNNPHIVFSKYTQSSIATLVYKYFSGSTWQNASIENDALPEFKSIDALAVTYADNRIHAAFIQGNYVYYAYRADGQWYIREAANDAFNTYPDVTNLRINVQKSGPDPEITIAYINSNKELVKVVSTRY